MRTCLLITRAIPEDLRGQIASGIHPRVEFLELAQRLEAEILDYRYVHDSGSLLIKIGKLLGQPMGLALSAWRRRKDFDLFYAGSETTGLILCALFKLLGGRTRIAILNHNLSNPWKSRFFQCLHLDARIDVLLCMNRFQAVFAKDKLRVSSSKLCMLQYGANVDGKFFNPARAEPSSGKYILSVGREQRDYNTMIEALRGTEMRAIFVASGIRASQEYGASSADVETVPESVHLLKQVPYPQLRDLYAGASFVVLCVHDVGYPAGVTAIMEAMAMGKTVIATRSRGISEYIEEGITGFWVQNGDGAELRERMLYLWGNPDIATRMGAEGRKWAADRVDLDRYVGNLAAILTELSP